MWKKYDCSKVLDYIHELNRLCDYESCRECPFDYMEDCNTMDIDQSIIDTLQKWSDEHPDCYGEPYKGEFEEEKTISDDLIRRKDAEKIMAWILLEGDKLTCGEVRKAMQSIPSWMPSPEPCKSESEVKE